MNWDAIGAVGEMLGAIAVFVVKRHPVSRIKTTSTLTHLRVGVDVSGPTLRSVPGSSLPGTERRRLTFARAAPPAHDRDPAAGSYAL